jgi:hypothetical protein
LSHAAADLAEELISAEAAAHDYGVEVAPDGTVLDRVP